MTNFHIGLDFDNTIVLYDEIFYKYALENNYISPSIEKTKKAVRNELIKKGKGPLFTEIQGIVYGKLISDAPIQDGFINALGKLHNLNYKISIVSHKTKYPIIGEKYDLHNSAYNWLVKNKVLENKLFKLNPSDIFFEETEEKKIKRIMEIGCTHYVDDLGKILLKLDDKVTKINFVKGSKNAYDKNNNFVILNAWSNFNKLIEKKVFD